MTTATDTLDDEQLATAYREDLHARCTYYRMSARFRECEWQPSGYCRACGRVLPTLESVALRIHRAALDASPVVKSLRELAHDFDTVAAAAAGTASSVSHEADRTAQQLRLVVEFVRNGTYDQLTGALWLRAGRRVLNRVRRVCA